MKGILIFILTIYLSLPYIESNITSSKGITTVGRVEIDYVTYIDPFQDIEHYITETERRENMKPQIFGILRDFNDKPTAGFIIIANEPFPSREKSDSYFEEKIRTDQKGQFSFQLPKNDNYYLFVSSFARTASMSIGPIAVMNNDSVKVSFHLPLKISYIQD